MKAKKANKAIALTDETPSKNEVNKANKAERLLAIKNRKLAIIEAARLKKEADLKARREDKKAERMAAVIIADKANSVQNVATVLPDNTSAVTIRIVQMTASAKTTFEMQSTVTARKQDATIKGLAKKTGYIVADSIYTQCKEALDFKSEHGYYGTSFRPKAVFKVYIIVDSVCTFAAINTKGVDAIRLFRRVDKKDTLISRFVLAQKFSLLAGIAQANQTFAELVSFELGTDSLLLQAQSEDVTPLENSVHA